MVGLLTLLGWAGSAPAGGADALKPALARNNLFLMAARGQAPGEQAMYLTGTVATMPEPTRLLLEVRCLSGLWTDQVSAVKASACLPAFEGGLTCAVDCSSM